MRSSPTGSSERAAAVVGELAGAQCGMVARRQLTALDVSQGRIQSQVAAGRWVERTPRVVSTTTGPLSRAQQEWLAVLHAGPRSMLGSLTSAARHGLTGWHRDEITVWVDDELSFEPVPGVRFFRSRRPFSVLRDARPGVPVARVEPSLLLWAAYEAPHRAAHAVLAAGVQQRLTSATLLRSWVDGPLKPLRRAPAFRATLVDIEGGSQSGAELDVVRLCRSRGLQPPERQVGRRDTQGRLRWTDCEWRLANGDVLVLEVDGGHHLEVRQWDADVRRARALTIPGRVVVRCTTYELRHEPDALVADLRRLGVPDAAACA